MVLARRNQLCLHLLTKQELFQFRGGVPTGDLSAQFVRPADARRCLGNSRAPPSAVDRHEALSLAIKIEDEDSDFNANVDASAYVTSSRIWPRIRSQRPWRARTFTN